MWVVPNIMLWNILLKTLLLVIWWQSDKLLEAFLYVCRQAFGYLVAFGGITSGQRFLVGYQHACARRNFVGIAELVGVCIVDEYPVYAFSVIFARHFGKGICR